MAFKNSQDCHHLDARVHARTGWFCRASVSHVVRHSTLISRPKPGGEWERGGSGQLDRGCAVPQAGARRRQKPVDRKRSRRVRSPAACLSAAPPAPPPSGQPSAGERQSQNERPVWLVYLRPDEAARAGVRGGSCLTVVTLFRGGREEVRWILWPPAVCPQNLVRLVRNQQRSKAISP